jgi:hypothetical protein
MFKKKKYASKSQKNQWQRPAVRRGTWTAEFSTLPKRQSSLAKGMFLTGTASALEISMYPVTN